MITNICRLDGYRFFVAVEQDTMPASDLVEANEAASTSVQLCRLKAREPHIWLSSDLVEMTKRFANEIEIVGIKDTVKTTCTGVEMFRKLLLLSGMSFLRSLSVDAAPARGTAEHECLSSPSVL